MTYRISPSLVLAPVAVLGLSISPIAAQAQSIKIPDGWTQKAGPNGASIFIPKDLAPGKSYSVTVFSPDDLKGRSPDNWLSSRVHKDTSAPGLPASVDDVQRKSDTIYSVSCIYKRASGPLIGIYTAVLWDGGQAGLLRVITSPDKNMTDRYREATSQIMGEYLKGGSRTSRQSAAAGTNLARRGGKLAYGRYQLVITHGSGQDQTMEVDLYPNGEWRKVFSGGNDWRDASTFTYNPATGALDLDVVMDLYNSTYSDDSFFFFGQDAQGKPAMYGEDDYGVGVKRTAGRYLGPNTRPAPAAEKEAKERREEEERRFKWVTAPGKGLAPAKIESVMHEAHNETRIGGMAFVETVTLLLKDGTCYSGLRCAPSDLSISASRLHEPEAWGRWRRQGSQVLVKWPKSSQWEKLIGSSVLPARSGEKLSGVFSTGSAINIAGNVSTFHRGVTFQTSGRFQTNHSSMHTTGISSNLATGTSISAYSDDNGSVVSAAPVVGAIAPGGASVATTRKRDPKLANVGTYQLDGYTITLKYDNGKVERLPFFFWDGKKDYIWVGEETFSKDKEK